MRLHSGVVAASFTPSANSNLQLWVRADDPLYQDSAGTTPATANGDAIKNLPDSSGIGNSLTRPSGTGAVLRIENGTRVIGFEGGYLDKSISSGSLSAFSLHALMRMSSPVSDANGLFAFGAAGVAPFIAPTWVLGKAIAYDIATDDGGGCGYQTDASWRVFSAVYDGSDVTFYLDGAIIGSSGNGPPEGQSAVASFTRAGYALGKENEFGNTFQGRIAELCYYESAHSAADVAQIDGYLRSRWATLLNTTDPQVTWISNSLGQNLIVTQANAIPYLVGNASSKVNRWVNASRPSITTSEMVDRIADDYAHFVASPAPKVAVIWEGTNDLAVGGANAATAYANLVSLAQSLRSVGYTKIVIGTILPRGTDGAFETARSTVNASILANTTDWDAVADVGADASIGAAGTQNNTTYYNGDKIHLIAAGNVVAAGIFRTAIDSVLP